MPDSSLLSASNPCLNMHRISKRFGATQALEDITLSVRSGETLALIGENGAGKSTLMKILSGAHAPDSGEMHLLGNLYKPRGPQDARRAGIAMVYQELSLAPDLSIEENIMLGQERSRWGWIRRNEQRQKVRDALKLLGYEDLRPERIVGNLPIGTQQIVEIARGLIGQAKVMVFDEPTSSLARNDVLELFRLIHRLNAQGIAIVYISHFLEEMREVAKAYTVLRDGRLAGQGQLADVSNSELVAMMVGRNVETLFPHVPHSIGETRLAARNLTGDARQTLGRTPQDIQLQLRAGEILGMFGLVGAGRTETLRLLMGLDHTTAGDVAVLGRPSGSSVASRMHDGLALVSEDRKTEGLSQSLSIADNLTLSHLRPYARMGLLRLNKRRDAAVHWMKSLRVKAASPDQPIQQLSGGNQQKVAIARVLHQKASILLLDEPTRGIDVGTKAEIYQWIGESAASGKSIIFVSSYLPELMSVCDTIAVMARGRIRDVRPTSQWTESQLLSAAVLSDHERGDEGENTA
jgi:ribose transport system ATP-binding protein